MWPMTKNPDWYLKLQRSLRVALKEFGALVVANRKLAIGGALGILVGVAGIFGFFAWERKQEEKAADLLFKAASQLAIRASTAEGAKQHDEAVTLLRDITDRYPRTAAAAEATLRLGNFFYTREDYDEARKVYQDYLARDPTGRVAFYAGLGVADCHLAQAQYEMAQRAYARLITDFPQHPLLAEAYLNLARTYLKMGKPRDAAGVYRKVAQAYPNTGWARTAQAHFRKLQTTR